LLDRETARFEIGNALGDDVADDHLVAEIGEAGRGDEAHPAGTEDSERLRHLHRV
jgi:hypothetical protein